MDIHKQHNIHVLILMNVLVQHMDVHNYVLIMLEALHVDVLMVIQFQELILKHVIMLMNVLYK